MTPPLHLERVRVGRNHRFCVTSETDMIMLKQGFFLLLLVGAFPFIYAQESLEYEDYKTLGGHPDGGVQNLRFSPNGKYLATAGLDKVVIIWDVDTGKPLRRLYGHEDEVYEATFSPDNSLLVTASSDGTARVWDVQTGSWKGTYQCKPFPGGRLENSVSFAFITQDNRYVVFGGNSGFLMKADISSPTNRAKAIYTANNDDGSWYSTITGGTVSEDGREAIISVGNRLDIVNIRTGKRVRQITYAAAGFNDVVYGPKSGQLAAWTYDGKVTIWDYKTKQLQKAIQVTYPRNYSGATFSQDRKYLATGACDNIAKIWDWENEKQVATLTGHRRLVRICRFNPKRAILATASYDGTVKFWREKEPEEEEEEITVVEPLEPPPTPTDEEEESTTETVAETPPRPELPEPSFGETDLEVGKTINLKNIRFKRGTAELLPNSYSDIETLIAAMKRHATMEVELRGHTDNVGKQSINLRLSGERVRVVRAYLIEHGISSRRITTRAYGGLEPISDNAREETRRLNRRVEIRIKQL